MVRNLTDDEKEARAILALVHARHRQDKIKSIAANLAGIKTKRERDNEVKRIFEKYKPDTVKSIIDLAKKLHGENKK